MTMPQKTKRPFGSLSLTLWLAGKPRPKPRSQPETKKQGAKARLEFVFGAESSPLAKVRGPTDNLTTAWPADSVAVDPTRSEVHCASGAEAPVAHAATPDPISRFQNHNLKVQLLQLVSRGEARNACADDKDAVRPVATSCVRHAAPRPPGAATGAIAGMTAEARGRLGLELGRNPSRDGPGCCHGGEVAHQIQLSCLLVLVSRHGCGHRSTGTVDGTAAAGAGTAATAPNSIIICAICERGLRFLLL